MGEFKTWRKFIEPVVKFDKIQEAKTIIMNNAEYLKDVLRYQQLALGINGDGSRTTAWGNPNYHPDTIFNKLDHGTGLGSEVKWITNYMTGDFYDMIGIQIEGNEFSFFSDVEYYQEVLDRSNPTLMNLTRENLDKFAHDILIPELNKAFQNYYLGV